MTTTETTAQVLIEYLESATHALNAIQVDTDLLESGLLDSLQVMDLVCYLERRFSVAMKPADINAANLRNVRRLTEYIHARAA